MRTANRLLKWIELGESPQVDDSLPYLGKLNSTREGIKQGVKDLEDPRQRIRRELFWPIAELSFYQSCQELLRAGKYVDLVAYCQSAIATAEPRQSETQPDTLDAALCRHFLAVFYHSAAVANSMRLRGSSSGPRPPTDWNMAFHHWSLVLQDDTFWAFMSNRVRALNDPRLDDTFVLQLKRELPPTLLEVNISIGLDSLSRGDSDTFLFQSLVIRKAPFPRSFLDSALEQLLKPLRMRFDTAVRETRHKLSDKMIHEQTSTLRRKDDGNGFEGVTDPDKLLSYLGGIEETINKRLVPIGRLVKDAGLQKTEAGRDILDGLAFVLRELSLTFNNNGGMPHGALRITRIAKGFAEGGDCVRRLAEDYHYLQFLTLQKDAIDLAALSQYKESLAKLKEALPFASTEEDKKTVEEWIETAKRKLQLGEIKPIDSAPSLYTINGIGSTLYGRRDFDSDTNTYVATLYFTFFFVPIIPLAAYRVKDAGTNRYQFYGKVPLTRSAYIGPGIAWLLVIILIIVNGFDNNSPSYSQGRLPRQTYTSSQAKQLLGERIEKERARLEKEKVDLTSMKSQLEQDRQLLDLSYKQLDQYSSKEQIKSYQDAESSFNRRVDIYNVRVSQYQKDAAAFNSEIAQYNSMQ